VNKLQQDAQELINNEALTNIIDRLKLDLLEQFAGTPAEKLPGLQSEYQWLDRLRNLIKSKCELIVGDN
jgi:hypothetical protein